LCEAISRSFLDDAFVFEGHRFLIRCSMGVALYPRDCDNRQQLLANADLAMFRAKAAGRRHHVMFDRAIRRELEDRLKLTAELERATERGEFELFYQPQVRLRDGKLVGAEALIRWRHPERGLVSPGEFIPVLNSMSISDRVAAWVMETACRQARLWQERGHEIQVGVNLSPSQFETGDLVAATARILAETGLPPALLELEVTENILLSDDARAVAIFRDLRKLGVHLALDDFGTGYASLNYLKTFPLTRVKIDQSFVREITPGSSDATIVASTINLSRLLGLSVIAEGVESLGSAELLMQMGCEDAQGFYFGRPMDVATFERTALAVPALPAGRPVASAA
jgi:EAL domain-containing protein (putative c-di-GMP-specific phosphodiesterase class I)